MSEVSIVIPNFNGLSYLEGVLTSLERQTMKSFEVILVDNGSSDGSVAYVTEHFPKVRIIQFEENTGFCRAVNAGIQASDTPYVILLNNDIETDFRFVEELVAGIKRHKRAFSCQAKMIQYHDRSKIDDAGNYYSALGWAYARGKGKNVESYNTEEQIFSSCAGAAIYRRSFLEKTGLFDEEHFAYLEDMDLGYRARIHGFENWYIPKSKVYHVGSGTSGSRYNLFKIRYSSRNNVYMIYKNMPIAQIILNLPFLIVGFGVKFVFFTLKGFGKEYAAGIKNGFQISSKEKKVSFSLKHIGNYGKIQFELWKGMIRRFRR
ncbi:MAG: glycosyltransferase family 2 protein [Eubacteriales bacterium]|nr:glycosyltransferase family 2 protein [Eubacteriales bacterium]